MLNKIYIVLVIIISTILLYYSYSYFSGKTIDTFVTKNPGILTDINTQDEQLKEMQTELNSRNTTQQIARDVAERQDAITVTSPQYSPVVIGSTTSIKTEPELIQFIEEIYSIINTGKGNDDNDVLIDNKTDRIINAIKKIPLKSIGLNAIENKTFNELKEYYPNLIYSISDAVRLYELFFAYKTMKLNADNNKTNVFDTNGNIKNATVYNSTLNLFENYKSIIEHFHNILIRPSSHPVKYLEQDDDDTRFYTTDKINEYLESLKTYKFPITQRIPNRN